MKQLTKLYGLAAIILALGMMVLTTACEGPQGPAGVNAAGTCVTCHSSDATDINLKFNQYDLSQHNRGIVYEEEAGRIACGGCHSGDGFAEAVALGVDDPSTVATSKINCKACHTIHQDYAMSDFGLRIDKGFAMRIGGTQIDFGKGNLCAKCHQGRKFTRTVPDTISPSGTGSVYSRLGPHYGTPSNVFAMNGPIQIPGSVAYPTSNPHMTGFKDACVTCHMSQVKANPAIGGHSFLTPLASISTIEGFDTKCAGCHDAAQIKTAAKSKEIAADLAIYRRKLIDKGWLDTTQAFNDEFPKMAVLGEYFATPGGKKRWDLTKEDVDVVMNYLYIAKDRSNGAHNPKYVYALVKNGLEYLNK